MQTRQRRGQLLPMTDDGVCRICRSKSAQIEKQGSYRLVLQPICNCTMFPRFLALSRIINLPQGNILHIFYRFILTDASIFERFEETGYDI